MREAFRLQKSALLQPILHENETFYVGIVYVGKEIFDFTTFEAKLKACFQKISEKEL